VGHLLSPFYFFYFSVLGVLIPFFPVYLKSLGYGPAQIGLLMAIFPATKILSPPIWGWLADRFFGPLWLVRLGSLISLLCFILMSWIPLSGLPSLLVLFGFSWSAVLPLFESVALAFLGLGNNRYADIRLWGSIGFVVSSLLAAMWIEAMMPIGSLPALMALLLAGQCIASSFVPTSSSCSKREAGGGGRPLRGRFWIFILGAFLLQVSHGAYYSFFSLFLDEHGYGRYEIGAIWSLGVLSEVLLFWGFRFCSSEVRSEVLLTLGLAITCLRWLALSIGIYHPIWIILVQVMHAGSFGLPHIAAIKIIGETFGDRQNSRGQGAYAGIGFGLGGLVGSLMAGYLWGRISGDQVFLVSALVAWLAFQVQVFGARLFRVER
jgi:PPP family 3-phenylpropionic acid transporter